jgi:hypothetical protein
MVTSRSSNGATACRSQLKSFFQMGGFSNGLFVAAILISGSLQLGVMTLHLPGKFLAWQAWYLRTGF